MHTVDVLNEAVRLAEGMGYAVRLEWLGGRTGGDCEFGGRKWMFVDLALSPVEQLDQITEALSTDPHIHAFEMSDRLREAMGLRKAA